MTPELKSSQEVEHGRCGTIEFIDDFRLLIGLGRAADVPPSLVIMNTGKDVEGTPAQTVFHLSYFLGHLSFTLERGTHKPYPSEPLAPFHHDPGQRIVVLNVEDCSRRLVVRVGAFLALLKHHEGTEIGWDEWKDHVVLILIDVEYPRIKVFQVSGCRLFCFHSTGSDSDFQMEVYDFSAEGRMKYMKKRASGMLGTVKYLTSARARAKIPRGALTGRGLENCAVLFYVSITLPSPPLE